MQVMGEAIIRLILLQQQPGTAAVLYGIQRLPIACVLILLRRSI
jgi:hypothetical protein